MAKPQAKIVRLSFGLHVAVYGDGAPSEAEWERYLAVLEAIGPAEPLLIFSWGGGPNLKQRRQLDEAVKHHSGKAAVVTTSRIARGIVKAIGWTGKQIRAFDFANQDEAFAYLGLSGSSRRQALRYARLLAEELEIEEITRLAS